MTEKSEARRDGARLQKNSGRGQYAKGDAKTDKLLIDYKEAERSFTLNKAAWAKVCTDAVAESRRSAEPLSPALKIILGTGNQKVRLAVVEWSLLEELLEQS